MSLILEALRKLDREKQTPERGFLVMAPAVWPSRHEGRRGWAWAAVAVAALVVLASAYSGRMPRPAGETAQRTAAATAALVTVPAAALPVPAVPTKASRPLTPLAVAPATTTTPVVARAEPATAPALVLQAISERDGRPVALISDRLLREGDEIEGARLVRIDAASVELEYQGRRMALHF